jgi:hypothetical protein
MSHVPNGFPEGAAVSPDSLNPLLQEPVAPSEALGPGRRRSPCARPAAELAPEPHLFLSARSPMHAFLSVGGEPLGARVWAVGTLYAAL